MPTLETEATRPVTPQMVEAGLHAWEHMAAGPSLTDVFTAIYRAMHTARPLSEGPV